MNSNNGEFICPMCNTKKMGDFTNWINKIKYNNNKPDIYWIFYKKSIWSEKECKSSYKAGWPFSKVKDCCLKCLCCYCFLWGFILYNIVYLLIFSWVDIIKYCCCKKNTYQYKYSYIDTIVKEGEIISEDDDNCIWTECEGTPENIWISDGYPLFHCNNCNWKSKTFRDFIKSRIPTQQSSMTNVNDSPDNEIVKEKNIEKNIAIIMTAQDQSFHYPIICNLNDTFEYVENELYKEHPEYKGKELFFLLSGNSILDKKKTLPELGIKNADNIIVYENTLNE